MLSIVPQFGWSTPPPPGLVLVFFLASFTLLMYLSISALLIPAFSRLHLASAKLAHFTWELLDTPWTLCDTSAQLLHRPVSVFSLQLMTAYTGKSVSSGSRSGCAVPAGMLVESSASSSHDSLPEYSPMMCRSIAGAGFSALFILLESETVYLCYWMAGSWVYYWVAGSFWVYCC